MLVFNPCHLWLSRSPFCRKRIENANIDYESDDGDGESDGTYNDEQILMVTDMLTVDKKQTTKQH